MNNAPDSWSPAAVMTGFALMMGVSVALIAWLISRSMATVPDEDREYKDPPPMGFRLVWFPIRWISFYLDRVLSDKLRITLHTQLRKGGLDYSLSPAQFLAARLIGAAVVGWLFWWLLGSFERTDAAAGFSERAYLQAALSGALLGWFYPRIWLHDRLGSRRRELLKSFPFYLDIITLCVEAGLNLQGAMRQAVAKGPQGVMRDELQRVQRDIRAGKARVESLRAMAERLNEPAITNFVIAVIQAESMGMNMGPVLRAQADQRRTERFLRAEKLAMEAPVKMLFPLIAFIFPCTFIVLAFPIAMKFLESGL